METLDTLQTLLDAPERNGNRITEHFTDEPLRLNLGAGESVVEGFTNIDRDLGTEVYPLEYPDGSVDEILASHVLEHFSHRDTETVLKHWVEKLKPGGRIRIAVPDFGKLVEFYKSDIAIDLQGYVMGAHKDSNDHHGCLFDRECLTETMAKCGLERIGAFDGTEYEAACQLPISLNLQGFKPSSPVRQLENVVAVMSAPRFGPTIHFRCHAKTFLGLRIDCKIGQSCYWAQRISIEMENALKTGAEFILTLDFDTVFSPEDVLELYRLMQAFPDADAIFPLQSKRACDDALFSLINPDGTRKLTVQIADLYRQMLPAGTGHFGLTLFRASSLARFPRPWMVPIPNKDGLWEDGHTDADIDFWNRFKANGFKAYLAPRIVVGHLEEVVKWPGADLKPVFQSQTDYEEVGIPAEVAR